MTEAEKAMEFEEEARALWGKSLNEVKIFLYAHQAKVAVLTVQRDKFAQLYNDACVAKQKLEWDLGKVRYALGAKEFDKLVGRK